MDDAISRQNVIDALEQGFKDATNGLDKFSPTHGLIKAVTGIYKCYIEQLPPEIVRCKDCKHHWTHRCMDSMPIEKCDLGQTFYDAEVDFCSLAEKREVTT